MLAAAGLGAVTFSHRFYGASALADAAGDVEAAVAYVRSHAEELGIDRDRVALWAFSGGGPFLSQSLRERWPFVRAIVAYYAVLDLQVPAPGAESGITDETRRELSPLHHLATGGEQTPPLLVARAGRDSPWLNATIDRYAYGLLRPRRDRQIRIESADFGLSVNYAVDEPPIFDGRLDLVKAAIRRLGDPASPGYDIFLHSNAPPGSGLGSSSTVMVTLLRALPVPSSSFAARIRTVWSCDDSATGAISTARRADRTAVPGMSFLRKVRRAL